MIYLLYLHNIFLNVTKYLMKMIECSQSRYNKQEASLESGLKIAKDRYDPAELKNPHVYSSLWQHTNNRRGAMEESDGGVLLPLMCQDVQDEPPATIAVDAAEQLHQIQLMKEPMRCLFVTISDPNINTQIHQKPLKYRTGLFLLLKPEGCTSKKVPQTFFMRSGSTNSETPDPDQCVAGRGIEDVINWYRFRDWFSTFVPLSSFTNNAAVGICDINSVTLTQSDVAGSCFNMPYCCAPLRAAPIALRVVVTQL